MPPVRTRKAPPRPLTFAPFSTTATPLAVDTVSPPVSSSSSSSSPSTLSPITAPESPDSLNTTPSPTTQPLLLTCPPKTSPPNRTRFEARPAPSLTPRPFPPPALSSVPRNYIHSQLRSLATMYWGHPETADCTLVVPVPFSSSRLVFKIHRDYLSASSTFLRAIFTCAPSSALLPPIPLSAAPTTTTFTQAGYAPYRSNPIASPRRASFSPQPSTPGHRRFGSSPSPNTTIDTAAQIAADRERRRASIANSTAHTPRTPLGPIPPSRRPRLLPPSTSQHPVLFLPVPDPASIGLLIRWMYFGDSDSDLPTPTSETPQAILEWESCPLTRALASGKVEWEGVARNVEYLGIQGGGLRAWMGRWFQEKARVEAAAAVRAAVVQEHHTIVSPIQEEASTPADAKVEVTAADVEETKPVEQQQPVAAEQLDKVDDAPAKIDLDVEMDVTEPDTTVVNVVLSDKEALLADIPSSAVEDDLAMLGVEGLTLEDDLLPGTFEAASVSKATSTHNALPAAQDALEEEDRGRARIRTHAHHQSA